MEAKKSKLKKKVKKKTRALFFPFRCQQQRNFINFEMKKIILMKSLLPVMRESSTSLDAY
jgi:hypothetical protein